MFEAFVGYLGVLASALCGLRPWIALWMDVAVQASKCRSFTILLIAAYAINAPADGTFLLNFVGRAAQRHVDPGARSPAVLAGLSSAGAGG